MPKRQFLLGTAVKITAILNVELESGDTAKITIDDPTEAVMIDAADMSREADGVYSYTYQSNEDGNDGDYVATIEVTYNGYTAVVQDKFTLEEQE